MAFKNFDLWLPAYLKNRAAHFAHPGKPERLWVTIADHYEPCGGNASTEIATARVRAWQERWPEIAAAAPKDVNGNQPCYTFFYPQEEYRSEVLEAIAEIVRTGVADVDVHIHHDHETNDGFRQKITEFCKRLHEDHGLLRTREGRLVFGFIHGNWALDNSRPDGRWCGVKGELQALLNLGCYADFTMPSLPSPTQSRVVNQIYWTTGDPALPRGFDKGIPATRGGGTKDGLLMIPGPLGVRYRDRLVPRMETGELAVYDPPTPYRVKRWLDLAPRIGGNVFLKLYAHGAREDNAGALLGTDGKPGTLAPMFRWIDEAARERNLEIRWVSAYGMFDAVDRVTRGVAQGAEVPA
ncbi:hypothetical protein [Terriglobus saanensis]|uniref:Uncharacterized protein n=1 Tax=Terriglobus saanensis (strain ATCC BAA-1853 / DSM 23119 / SP1PR4) TaxID=401053 RepID=E8V400_TERSS|nr:hypothetical protein [Terriglobus saanensis]ADV81414.1 hypothetical protein AciPR4_0579 [Terriglobus saanensis SP1PR4]